MTRSIFATFLLIAVIESAGCAASGPEASLTSAERTAIGDSVKRLLFTTQTFDESDVVKRFMSIYPTSGRVVSASSGTFSTTRDSLQMGIAAFWEGAGRRMQKARWVWGPTVVDVLSRDGVVITAQYTIPHWTPEGAPHVFGGAWTSVWRRSGGKWEIVQEHLSEMPRASAAAMEATMRPLPDTTRR